MILGDAEFKRIPLRRALDIAQNDVLSAGEHVCRGHGAVRDADAKEKRHDTPEGEMPSSEIPSPHRSIGFAEFVKVIDLHTQPLRSDTIDTGIASSCNTLILAPGVVNLGIQPSRHRVRVKLVDSRRGKG